MTKTGVNLAGSDGTNARGNLTPADRRRRNVPSAAEATARPAARSAKVTKVPDTKCL